MKKQNMCSIRLLNKVDIMLGIVFDTSQLDACLIGFKNTDIRIKMIKFVIQLLDRKIQTLYEKKKAKLEQSEV